MNLNQFLNINVATALSCQQVTLLGPQPSPASPTHPQLQVKPLIFSSIYLWIFKEAPSSSTLEELFTKSDGRLSINFPKADFRGFALPRPRVKQLSSFGFWWSYWFAGEILALCDSYCSARREYYFDRSPRVFENILGLYRKVIMIMTWWWW